MSAINIFKNSRWPTTYSQLELHTTRTDVKLLIKEYTNKELPHESLVILDKADLQELIAALQAIENELS